MGFFLHKNPLLFVYGDSCERYGSMGIVLSLAMSSFFGLFYTPTLRMQCFEIMQIHDQSDAQDASVILSLLYFFVNLGWSNKGVSRRAKDDPHFPNHTDHISSRNLHLDNVIDQIHPVHAIDGSFRMDLVNTGIRGAELAPRHTTLHGPISHRQTLKSAGQSLSFFLVLAYE